MTREIALSRGMIALVDDADFELLAAKKWSASRGSSAWYAITTGSVLMHRVIMGAGTGEFIDHINRNGLDNRRANLRKCTQSENQVNRKSRNPHGFRGVTFYSNKYIAQVGWHNSRHYIGIFETPIEAARAYDLVAKELHGEFAILNFPVAA